MEALDELFLGRKLSVPDIALQVPRVKVGALVVNSTKKHKRGPGKPTPSNFQYYFMFQGHQASKRA